MRRHRSRVIVVLVSLAAITVSALLPPTRPEASASAYRGAAAAADPECLAPAPTAPPPGQTLAREDWRGQGLARQMRVYRARHDISAGRNVAVFQYCDKDGRLLTVTVASAGSTNRRAVYDYRDKDGNLVRSFRLRRSAANKHAEMLLRKQLLAEHLPLANVRKAYSEFQPCPTRGCKAMVDRELAHVPFGYSYRYGTEGSRETNEHEAAVKAFYDELKAVRPLFRLAVQANSVNATGALLETLTMQGSSAPGGIDFSSIGLRYVADKSSDAEEGLRYAFRAQATADGRMSGDGLLAAQQASDAFFVWLALPPSSFTINLNPDEPDRIVDAKLGRTDAGRILLEADLQLKRTTAALIHPDTELGARFWNSLRGTCGTYRMWITPGIVRVRETLDELYILDARLSVSTEAEHLGRSVDSGCGEDEATQSHDEQIFRSMILPKIYHAVNNAPEYQDLRRVYLSRVAAQWIRDRSAKTNTAYSSMIDKGEIGPWMARQPWDPQDVFKRYVKSFTDGEFNVTRTTEEKTDQGTLIRKQTFIYGGVDFTRSPRLNVSDAVFQEHWAHLPGTIDSSVLHVTSDVDGQHLWLGGGVGVASESEAVGAGGESLPEPRVVVIFVGVALLGTFLVAWLLVARRAARSRGAWSRASSTTGSPTPTPPTGP